MCSSCDHQERGPCLCGTSADPYDRNDPCGAKGSSGYCAECGHHGKSSPTPGHHYDDDVVEY